MSKRATSDPTPKQAKKAMQKKLSAFRRLHAVKFQEYLSNQPTSSSDTSTPKPKKHTPPTPDNLIGYRLWYLRKHRGYSQETLASLAQVSRSTIIRCENKGVAPTIDNLERLILHLTEIEKFLGENLDEDETWESQFGVEEVFVKGGMPLEIEDLRQRIHDLIENRSIVHTHNGHTIFMSQTDELLLLKQIDSTLDMSVSMLSRTRPHIIKIINKYNGK